MSDDKNEMKVLLPMIRKVMPSVIASQIVGVQPMTGAVAAFKVIDQATLDTNEVWYTMRVNWTIKEWIVENFVKTDDYVMIDEGTASPFFMHTVDIPERILLLLKLKWDQ